MADQAAIPALIVSGFLGSGKTTLVQHLLRQAQSEGVRLAIISNEFGDTGIDRALLDAGEEGFVELDGGCVCCRLSDALGETLEMILTQTKPDRLVLELSGVALPGEVLLTFWRPPISDLVSEEVVVVVVDADRLLHEGAEDDTMLEQLEAADLVLLNKCDLLDEPEVERAAAIVDGVTGGQPLLHTVQSEVDPALLFPPDPSHLRQGRRDVEARPRAHSHERFGTTELSFPGVVDPDVVLADVREQHAIRAKGFVLTEQGVRVLQGVGQRINLQIPDKDIPDHLVGRVVVIHKLDGHEVHEH